MGISSSKTSSPNAVFEPVPCTPVRRAPMDLGVRDDDQIPSSLKCEYTHELMHDPVDVVDIVGIRHVYERAAIEAHMAATQGGPILASSRVPLHQPIVLIPNARLKQTIVAFLADDPLLHATFTAEERAQLTSLTGAARAGKVRDILEARRVAQRDLLLKGVKRCGKPTYGAARAAHVNRAFLPPSSTRSRARTPPRFPVDAWRTPILGHAFGTYGVLASVAIMRSAERASAYGRTLEDEAGQRALEEQNALLEAWLLRLDPGPAQTPQHQRDAS